MIIYGLSYIKNQFNCLEFSLTNESNKVNCLKFNTEILSKTNIKKAIFCDNLSEVLQCNAALVDYIIPSKNILKKSVELAELYLFDSKILTLIKSADDLESLAFSGVDCVLFMEFNQDLKDYYGV